MERELASVPANLQPDLKFVLQKTPALLEEMLKIAAALPRAPHGYGWLVGVGCERCGVWKVWGVWGRRLLLPCPGPLIATDGMCRMKERIKCDWSVGAWGWRSRCTQAKRGQVEVVLTTRKNRPPRPP